MKYRIFNTEAEAIAAEAQVAQASAAPRSAPTPRPASQHRKRRLPSAGPSRSRSRTGAGCLYPQTMKALKHPPTGGAYQFQLPANFISMVELNGVPVSGTLGEDWEIEGDKLLTDAAEAKVRFIGYDEDTHNWDPLFVNAVVVNLASKIALLIRKDDALAQALLSEYQRVSLPQARMKDGNERKRKRFDPWEDSRFVQSRRYSTNG
jgi:hypothetical protein